MSAQVSIRELAMENKDFRRVAATGPYFPDRPGVPATGDKRLRLVTIHSPAHHAPGTVHETREEADEHA